MTFSAESKFSLLLCSRMVKNITPNLLLGKFIRFTGKAIAKSIQNAIVQQRGISLSDIFLFGLPTLHYYHQSL
jgi:hypothetical protein